MPHAPADPRPYSLLPPRVLRLGLALALLLPAAGCADPNVWVYVDNGGDRPMVVSVDGNEVAAIDPGEFEKLIFPPGERHFRVRCGQEVVFDGAQDLVKPDRLGVGRRYLFNPDHRNRYAAYKIEYGTNRLTPLLESALVGQADEAGRRRYAYQKLIAEVKLLPAETWVEVPDGAYVLTMPPEVVASRTGHEWRTVLNRIEHADYAFLEAARDRKDPTDHDVDALREVVTRVLQSEP